jgi:hypothetical protein
MAQAGPAASPLRTRFELPCRRFDAGIESWAARAKRASPRVALLSPRHSQGRSAAVRPRIGGSVRVENRHLGIAGLQSVQLGVLPALFHRLQVQHRLVDDDRPSTVGNELEVDHRAGRKPRSDTCEVPQNCTSVGGHQTLRGTFGLDAKDAAAQRRPLKRPSQRPLILGRPCTVTRTFQHVDRPHRGDASRADREKVSIRSYTTTVILLGSTGTGARR